MRNIREILRMKARGLSIHLQEAPKPSKEWGEGHIAGYSQRFVALVYMGLALIGTVIALLWYKRALFVNVVVIVLLILLFAGLWRFTVRVESHAHSGA